MKSLRSALILTVCLALAGNVPAAPHSGTSSSFKSGFSRNTTLHSKPAAPPASRQSGPGAFGKQAGSPASSQPPRNTSAMSRDVDQAAARDNALKSLDARRAADAGARPLPPLNDTLRQPQGQPQPIYQAPPYPGPAPVYQQSGSSGNALMHGVIGFMLGRAMSHSNQPVAYPTTGQPQQQQTTMASGQTDSYAATGMPGLAAPVPAPQPKPSFGASVLRWFIWLSVLSLLMWAVVYSVRKLRRLRSTPNYSFERN